MTGYSPFSASISLIIMSVVGFGLVVLFAGILQQIGAPVLYISLLMMVFIIGLYLFSGLFAKTMRFSSFQTADKKAHPVFTGMMVATGTLSGTTYILFPGLIYTNGTDFLVFFLGILLGVGLLTILFAASLSRSPSATLTGFLFPDGTNKLIVCISVIVIFSCSFLFLISQMKLATIFMESFYGTGAQSGVTLIVSVAVLMLILGGIQSLSISRMLAYPILLVVLFIPLIWTSYNLTGNPVPQLAFGDGALTAIEEIDREMLSAGIATTEEIFNPVKDGIAYEGLNFLASLLTVAFAFASMPHLLQHFTMLQKGRHARRSGIWAFVLIAIVLTSIPAIAVFAKLDLYTLLLGLRLDDLPEEAPWVFALSGQGSLPLLVICGELVSNLEQSISACGQSGDYFLSPRDIKINPEYLMLSFAILNNLPQLLTVVLAAGALLAVFAVVDGTLLVMANTVTTDFYKRVVRPKSPPGVRLFMNRFFIVIIAITAIIAERFLNFKIWDLFVVSTALTAASLFPAMLCRIFLPKTDCVFVGSIMLLSFSATFTISILAIGGFDLLPGTGDEIQFVIPYISEKVEPLSFGLFGVFLFFVVLITVSLIHKRIQISPNRETANATG